jgi:hypothetical protein
MSAQLAANPMNPDLIARAGREIWDRRITSLRRRVDGSRIRRRIKAIDSLINQLEERHLTGERSFDRVLRQRLYRLEDEVGVPLPRKAIRARNTVRLHAALLDWQETLLDSMVPERQHFPDAHDNDWATPHPVGW